MVFKSLIISNKIQPINTVKKKTTLTEKCNQKINRKLTVFYKMNSPAHPKAFSYNRDFMKINNYSSKNILPKLVTALAHNPSLIFDAPLFSASFVSSELLLAR